MSRLMLVICFYIFTHIFTCTVCENTDATIIYKPNDPVADAQVLRAAMKGWGTTEADLIRILGGRTGRQRAAITAAYKTNIKRDLIEDIKDDTGDTFEDILVDLTYSVEEYLAREINWALKENKLDYIDIICTCTGNELQQIKAVYFNVFKVTLSFDIENKVKYVPTRMLLLRIVAGFDLPYRCNDDFNEKTVKTYKKCIPDKQGDCTVETNGEFFTLMSKESFRQIQAVVKDYNADESNKDHPVTARIEEFCEDKGLKRAYTTIASFSENSAKYFAVQLKDAIKGLGTNEKVLNRIIIWRCEIDLVKIEEAFFDLTHQSLEKWVKGDTTGDYESVLIKLIRGNRKDK
ncbi:hypothetical protein LSTR_LSTR001472 [Laodelphax striatellus]|uniref:Annexin n=1 Tax=Laodelphax striatellus TaxID=195883 RepID=A0A482XAF5_LAOST|nr:hypothetical protein LSTR_LSTR001472 [Laodelphax striatellus]